MMKRFALLLIVLCAATADAQYAEQVLSDMPAVYWKLDEPSGTAATNQVASTYSGTTGGATFVNSPNLAESSALEPWGVGALEKSVEFTGSQYAYSANTVAGRDYWYVTGSFTLEAWIKLVDEGTTQDLWYKYGADYYFRIGQNADDDLTFDSADYTGACDPSVSSDINVNDTKWHHYAWVYDSDADTWSGFKDGVRQFYVTSCVFSITNALADVYLQKARFDEVAFYKWALPDDRIKAHYMSRKPCVSASGVRDSKCLPQEGQAITHDNDGNGWLMGPAVRTVWFSAGLIDVDGTQCLRDEQTISTHPDKRAVVMCTEGGTESISIAVPLPPDLVPGPLRPRLHAQSKNATPAGVMTTTTHGCCRAPGEADSLCSSNTDRPDLTFTSIAQWGPVNGVGHTLASLTGCNPGDWLTLQTYIGQSGGTMTDMLIRGMGFDYRSHLRGGGR